MPADSDIINPMAFKRALLLSAALCLLAAPARAEVIDTVVAFVDTRAITLSEFREAYGRTQEVLPGATGHEVLNTMINRVLLLREARKLRLDAVDEDELLEEYIDLKFRVFINIKESEIRDFYDSHEEEFAGRSYDEVEGEIESYLLEKEINSRIRRHLEDLRKEAHIKILLKEEP
jgi:hypothetical protein